MNIVKIMGLNFTDLKLKDLYYYYFGFNRPTVEGNSYTIKNPQVLFRKKGIIKLSNGYEIPFYEKNKKDILKLINFILYNGIQLGNNEFQWKFDYKNQILETHQGIKFHLSTIGMLEETFLHQIHFAGFNLKDKIVITAGAYIGDTPLFYSYYGAKVLAFEPDPISFKEAILNINLNPNFKDNILLKNYAIGKDGEVDFPVLEDSGGASIYKLNGKKTIKVISKSISSILDEFNIINPYLLDLDIKGCEFDVILDPSISKFEKVRIEYSPYLLKDPTKNINFLIKKLKEYGFSQYRIYKHNYIRFDLLNHGTLEAEK